MKIVSISMTHGGSTGNIMRQISECARNHGYQAVSFSPQGGVFLNGNKSKIPNLKGCDPVC